MRRGNGTGCVTRLSGNRRNPWYAKVPDGLDDKGNYIQKILSNDKGEKYFKDRLVPDELLLNWNKTKGNIDLDKTDYTFKQVFEDYKNKYFPTKEEMLLEKKEHIKTKGKLGISTKNNLQAAYNKCSAIHDRLYKSLRKEDFMNIIIHTEGCGTVINSLANLFKKLDNYALEHDIILKGYANLITITDDLYLPTQKEGTPYSYEEINTIWDYEGELVADITLLTIYEGCRIEELLFTKTEDVHLEDAYFVAGIKTTAGKRRVIPIHHEVLEIFCKYYNPDNEFLFTINNEKIDYNSQFLKMYNEFMEKLRMNHNTHDGRKTLASEFDRVGANKNCRDKILGHKSGNIGDDVYTKKGIEELRNTIEMIDYKSKRNTKITYLSASY